MKLPILSYTEPIGNLILKNGKPQMYRFSGGYYSYTSAGVLSDLVILGEMQNEKQKVKTTAKEINVKDCCLVLNKSVGVFVIGEPITIHLALPHEYYHCTDNGPSMPDYDFYFFPKFGMSVYMNDQTPAIIDSIMCRKYCYWHGRNLIGMLYREFLQITHFTPIDSVGEINYVYSREHKYRQRLYEFETEGLMVWTWRNRIVSITVSRETEEP